MNGDGKVKIFIMDNGTVIPENIRESIFKPFVCAEESRTTGSGSGLGLAITMQIVKKLNGSLYLQDGEEGYTKAFVIELEAD